LIGYWNARHRFLSGQGVRSQASYAQPGVNSIAPSAGWFIAGLMLLSAPVPVAFGIWVGDPMAGLFDGAASVVAVPLDAVVDGEVEVCA
jgi:hypothetical protein